MRFLFLWFLLTIVLTPQAPATDIVPIVLRHEEWVSGAVLSDDGSRVLSWSGGQGDNTVRIWNLDTQEWSMEGPFWQGGRYDFTGISSVAWSPDNRRYAVAVQPVHTCQPRCGYQVWAGGGQIDSVNHMEWHPDSRHLLVWKNGTLPREGLTLGVYDTETDTLLSSLEGHFDAVYDAVWAADGETVLYLAYNFDDNANPAFYFVGSWIPGETAPREQIAAPVDGFYVSWIPGDTLENTVVIAQYAPGRFVSEVICYEIAEADCDIDHIWVKLAGSDTFTEFVTEGGWANLSNKTLSPSGRWLSGLVADWRDCKCSNVYLWNTAEPTAPLRVPIDFSLAGQVWNPDETRLLLWYRHDECEMSCNGDVRLLDANSGELTLTLPHDGETVRGAQWSADGSQIMTWSNAIEVCEVDCGSVLRLWSAETGKMLFELLSDRRYVGKVIWREAENRVLVVFGRLIYIVDLSGATDPLVLNGHQLMPSVTWEGDTVLSWSGDETVRVWDLTGQTAPFEAGEVLWRIEEDTELGVTNLYGHTDSISGVTFNSDETALLSWSVSDSTARVWDLIGQHDPIVMDEFIRSHSVYLSFNEAAWLDDGHVITHSDLGTAIWSIADPARLDDPERLPYEAFETLTTGRTRFASVVHGWETSEIVIYHADAAIADIVLPLDVDHERINMDFLNNEQWLLVKNESSDILWLWDISDAANVRLLAQMETEGTPSIRLLHNDLLPLENDNRLKFYRLPDLELVNASAIEGNYDYCCRKGGWDSTNERLLYVSNSARDCEPDCHYATYIDNPFDNTPPLELEHEAYIQQADWIVSDSVIVTHSAHEYLSDMVTLWDTATGAKLREMKYEQQIWFVTWDERHNVLLVASGDELYLYNGLQDTEPDIYEHPSTVSGARLDSTGTLLVVWGSNGYTYSNNPAAIRVWRLE
jgi:WD40 repeat protein